MVESIECWAKEQVVVVGYRGEGSTQARKKERSIGYELGSCHRTNCRGLATELAGVGC